jgi:hypothetical protein
MRRLIIWAGISRRIGACGLTREGLPRFLNKVRHDLENGRGSRSGTTVGKAASFAKVAYVDTAGGRSTKGKAGSFAYGGTRNQGSSNHAGKRVSALLR